MNSIRAGGVTVSHLYSTRNEPLRPADPSTAGLSQITAGAYADAPNDPRKAIKNRFSLNEF